MQKKLQIWKFARKDDHNGPPHMAVQKQDDQLELTYSNYVRTQDVTLKTCRRWWMIGRSGERGSGISVLAARHDDDDDDDENELLLLLLFTPWDFFISALAGVWVTTNLLDFFSVFWPISIMLSLDGPNLSRQDRFWLCIYHLFVRSNLNLLHNFQWITMPTKSCLVLHSFCAFADHVINRFVSITT